MQGSANRKRLQTFFSKEYKATNSKIQNIVKFKLSTKENLINLISFVKESSGNPTKYIPGNPTRKFFRLALWMSF